MSDFTYGCTDEGKIFVDADEHRQLQARIKELEAINLGLTKTLVEMDAEKAKLVEPVGWQCVWPGGGTFTTDSYESAKNYQEGAISSHGEDQAPFIRPLFADPKAAEQQPDVARLVEALDITELRKLLLILRGNIGGAMWTLDDEEEELAVRTEKAIDALAAHRKGGSDNE